MAPKDKGNISEGKVRAYFEKLYYLVAKHGKKVNWIFDKSKETRKPVVADVDLFGAFDLVAARFDKKVIWIQVCGNNDQQIADRKKKIETLLRKFSPEHNRFLLFAYEGGRKTVDKRYKKSKKDGSRYKPWDFFNVYELHWKLIATPKGASGALCMRCVREPSDDEKAFGEELAFFLEWSEPRKLMYKPNVEGKCWACGKEFELPEWDEDTEIDVELICPDHEWAGNQWVII